MESSYESHSRIMNNAYPLGISYHRRANDDNIHWHENIEILYFLNGECSVVNGSEEMQAKKGDIIVINSEAIHGIRFHNAYSEYILVHLDHSFCETMGFNTGDVHISKIIHDSEIEALIVKALEEQKSNAPFYQESVKITLLSVLLILFRKYLITDSKEHKISNKVKLTKKIIKYINKHYDEQLTIEAIEGHCRYSRFYISRAFKEITGLTIMEYLNAIRIEKAKSLLQIGALSISEIAAGCGFVSQSYFGKVFKKSVGISPLEYKHLNK